MKLVFIGADHEVAGSRHFLKVGASKVLIDYGTEQGNSVYQNAELPVSYREVDYVSLTYTHVGHAGMLSWVYARGLKGQVIIICATMDLCNIMLEDGAHIQEMETEQKNRKARRTGRVEVETLYTTEDTEDVLKHFEGVVYSRKFELNNDLILWFMDVGHLLGSASIEIWVMEDKKTKEIVFSGDIGSKNKPLIRDPQCISEADYVVMGSVYGSRYHRKDVSHVESLARIIQETLDRSSNAVISAFAAGHIQELLYLIRHIKDEKLIQGHDGFGAYVDSPLAVEATHMFKESIMECYDAETKALMEHGINPTDFPRLKLSITNGESKNINFGMTSKVIISATGMCDAGRVRHHLRHNLWRQEYSIVFAGYQTEGTLGRVLQDGAQAVKILGEEIDVGARIEAMDDISDHVDKDGLITWVPSSGKRPGYVFVVHEDGESCILFADVLNTQLKLVARTPYSGSQYDLIRGCWIKEAESVLIEKETAVERKATGVYTHLVDAGRLLMDMISRNQGSTNKDLVHFTEQILALCNKWDR